jgi:hypothetical protein
MVRIRPPDAFGVQIIMKKFVTWVKGNALACAVSVFGLFVGISALADLPAGAPPGAIDGFNLDTIGTAVAPVIGDVVTALGVIFGLLFSIVIIRFTWRYIRSAFGR